MTGSLDIVKAALQVYTQAMQAAGLILNPSDSCTYIPSWRSLSPANLEAQAGVKMTTDHKYCIDMGNGDSFPLELTGIKVLGCPIGTQAYCEHIISSTIAKIEAGLQLLKDFKWRHQRAKLAIYCCNTLITYLLLAAPVLYTLHLAKADLLCFESGYENSQPPPWPSWQGVSGSSHLVTWTAWVQFPPDPQSTIRAFCALL